MQESFYGSDSRNKKHFDFPNLVSQVRKNHQAAEVGSRSKVQLPRLDQVTQKSHKSLFTPE